MCFWARLAPLANSVPLVLGVCVCVCGARAGKVVQVSSSFKRGLVLFPLKFLGPLVVSAGTPLDLYLSFNCFVDPCSTYVYASFEFGKCALDSHNSLHILHFLFGRVVLASYPQFHTSSSSFCASCHLYYKIMRSIPDQLSYGATSVLTNFAVFI